MGPENGAATPDNSLAGPRGDSRRITGFQSPLSWGDVHMETCVNVRSPCICNGQKQGHPDARRWMKDTLHVVLRPVEYYAALNRKEALRPATVWVTLSVTRCGVHGSGH